MQRREFLGTTCLAGAAALGAMATPAGAGEPGKKQILELKRYALEAGDMRARCEKFLAEAAVPAWNRLGSKPVGVFGFADGKSADLYVLVPHDSAEAFVTAPAKLWADADFVKAGEPFINPPKETPTYNRVSTWVLLGFDACPRVAAPTKKETRLFQMRTYPSYSDAKARKKREMFNTGGELALFLKLGMAPVFFGEALAGSVMPNLTYMLVFDDEAAQKAAWDKFQASDEWKKLKDDPQYADTVIGPSIVNEVLKPLACSQI